MTSENLNEEQQKVWLVKQALNRPIFLTQHQYLLVKEAVENTKFTGDKYTFLFMRSEKDRSIELRFSPSHEMASDFIGVYVETPDHRTLNIQSYLKKKNISTAEEAFDLDSYAGAFPQRLKAFLDYLGSTFETCWKEVLIGTAWADIPIDWQGYK